MLDDYLNFTERMETTKNPWMGQASELTETRKKALDERRNVQLSFSPHQRG